MACKNTHINNTGPTHFRKHLQELVHNHAYVIDRPKGSAHPIFLDCIYPVDYGHLSGTHAPGGQAIDCFIGTSLHNSISDILCTVDLMKKDTEIQVLIACTKQAIADILCVIDAAMGSIFIPCQKAAHYG